MLVIEPLISPTASDILPLNEWSNGDLRLAGNGSTAMAGRLEIYINTADTGLLKDCRITTSIALLNNTLSY